jgi:GNAT superfamily N-acetyltransferase
MSVNLIEVKDRKQLKTFIYLPEKLHRGRPNWVPPIYMDEWAYFDPRKNKAFEYSDTILLLAEKDGQVAGRVMGIINRRYNEVRNEKTARFGYLESIKDQEVVHALLSRVEEWAREKGMTRIIGPYGFSDQDPEGFLIKGFEHRATIATYYNFEWMPEMVEKEGYTKDIDYFVYKIEIPKEIPELYRRVSERILKKGNFQLLEFKKRKEIKPWVRPILSLMNETYVESNIYGYAPLDEKEMDALAKKYLPVLDPRFVKAVLKDGQVVAFIIGIPDLTAGIQKARGRLFPFGFIHILRASKKTKQLDLLLGAIKKEYRGQGLDALMGLAMISSAQQAGFEIIDTHHEMESNVRVRAEMERMGGQVYKIYRVYQKSLV